VISAFAGYRLAAAERTFVPTRPGISCAAVLQVRALQTHFYTFQRISTLLQLPRRILQLPDISRRRLGGDVRQGYG
jgi:hypothetical protein